MITFLVNKGFEYTVNEYLRSKRGDAVRDYVRVMPYSKIGRIVDDPQHLIVFTDHERLTAREKKRLTRIWEFLRKSCPDLLLYNEPTRVLVRHDLLKRLHEKGINKFQSFNLGDNLDELSYPVFIRSKFEHSGNLTHLIHSREELVREIRMLLFPRNIYRKKDLLIVEFYDSRDPAGIFRKHTVHRINRKLIPRALGFSSHWMVKSGILSDDKEHFREKLRFMQSEPESTELNSVFDLANIDYGRLDFVYTGQSFQVWEINTNPMIEGWAHKMLQFNRERSVGNVKLNEEAKDIFFARFRDQLYDLLEKPAAMVPTIPVTLLFQLKMAIYRARIGQELRNMLAGWYRYLFIRKP